MLLEQTNQLEDAKNNPKNYDSMLQIDLKEFKNSDEFRYYLKEQDAYVDKLEGLSIGYLLALLTEISMAFLWCLNVIYNKTTKLVLKQ